MYSIVRYDTLHLLPAIEMAWRPPETPSTTRKKSSSSSIHHPIVLQSTMPSMMARLSLMSLALLALTVAATASHSTRTSPISGASMRGWLRPSPNSIPSLPSFRINNDGHCDPYRREEITSHSD